jgi:hypothetical protein
MNPNLVFQTELVRPKMNMALNSHTTTLELKLLIKAKLGQAKDEMCNLFYDAFLALVF